MTFAEKFKNKAQELMPNVDELQQLPLSANDHSSIDEHMFRNHGEYVGGMAAVILALIK